MFELTKENNPRELRYYAKAFPNLTAEDQEKFRDNWVKKNIKKK